MANLPKVGTNQADTFDFTGDLTNTYEIKGRGGDDSLKGGELADFINGGKGNDVMNGNAGDDTMLGGAGNDVLFGGDGFDFMKGGAGVDFLNGNAGDAEMSGGSGVDNFQLDLGAGRVVITDFTGDADTLLLDGGFFPGKSIQQILTQFGSSSGGDSAIDLSRTGADSPRLILLGVDNIFDLANDIVII